MPTREITFFQTLSFLQTIIPTEGTSLHLQQFSVASTLYDTLLKYYSITTTFTLTAIF